MIKKVFSIVILVLGLISCSKSSYYEKIYSFKDRVWNIDEVAEFDVDFSDTSTVYQFNLTIRTTTDYQYNNLWFFWTSITPDGTEVREPFMIKITDDVGNWLGKKSGSMVENQLSFQPRKISVPGKYKFKLEQAVTTDVVDEVVDLGLIIEKK